ncbi:MAG TPA: DUF2400 family protein [Thermodesulforhabdus norvegica]|uniref:DUF2400 family protein n=1 Tax=Thermodesulforhabdus norvegica TaxID=39841 RepID=A0A7C1AWS9_9BACT|nr:DUF2400 family protein [Thermodesulforhabdus norvegica]
MEISAKLEILEKIYRHYHSPASIGNDPVRFVHAYFRLEDREIAALLAAMLAYGHVTQIKKKVGFVLNLLNPSPYRALIQNQDTLLWSVLKNFKHRFT